MPTPEVTNAGQDPAGDAVDRVADLTDAWETSPLTEPEAAIDLAAKDVGEHGDSGPDGADSESESPR